MQTVAFHTLGCKVNQYDAQAMLEKFMEAGYALRDFNEVADVYVVNTCTVTGTGDKKSLNAVRRALRQNPLAEVVITGCLAQREGEALLSTGARLVLGTARRGEVVELLERAVRENEQVAAVSDVTHAPFERLTISGDNGHTRAVMKIQEGCDRYCAYCIIPYVRGGLRSREPTDILAQARRLKSAGFEELVLTGIHLTSYGRDLEHVSLIDGVRAAANSGVKRLRLGSLEPIVATQHFVAALKDIPAICPQFHLALQSGSDEILRAMRRRYTTAEFRDAAARLREAFPGCALTTDVIVGFPGETQQHFEETVHFCREIGFARLHVFPYSARKGTKAALMPRQVPKAERLTRARTLIEAGQEVARAYQQTQLNTTHEVLYETAHDGSATGYTKTYMPVFSKGAAPNTIIDTKLIALDNEGFIGEIIAP